MHAAHAMSQKIPFNLLVSPDDMVDTRTSRRRFASQAARYRGFTRRQENSVHFHERRVLRNSDPDAAEFARRGAQAVQRLGVTCARIFSRPDCGGRASQRTLLIGFARRGAATLDVYVFSEKSGFSEAGSERVHEHGPHRDDHSTWTISLRRLRDFDQASFPICCGTRRRLSTRTSGLSIISPKRRSSESKTIRFSFLDTGRTEKHLLVTTHDLKKYVPDVYWTMVFGAPYVTLFSREKLLSAPVHRVEELENGSVVLQLTPDLRDTCGGRSRLRERAPSGQG